MRAFLLTVLIGFSATVTAQNGEDELDERFGKDVLIIVANRHACYLFDIYLALDTEQHRRGLMFVRKLPATTGMLFAYPREGRHSMWMKNTFIPLDIVFAKADGTVSSVIHNTEPQSLESLASIEPVSFVLELNAGVAANLSIDAGSLLVWDPEQ